MPIVAYCCAGLTSDGSPKVRPIDDLSISGVNICCQPSEKLQHDGIDALFMLTRAFVDETGVLPGLLKADIDSAFRRIPVMPCHRWAAGIAVLVEGSWYTSCHYAMPFGAVGSVFAWERVGALLCHLGRRLLHIPLLRHVLGINLLVYCFMYVIAGMLTTTSHQCIARP